MSEHSFEKELLRESRHKNNPMKIKARVKDKDLIGEKRKQIIEGAMIVFKKKGYYKATVREIAKEAQIGLGSTYDYVNSKDDILYLFFENDERTFSQGIRPWPSGITNAES
jgi:AcrR family transcriptional regulator